MQTITSIQALEALYGDAPSIALDKVLGQLTPLYRQWIQASRFLVLSTVGPEGTDISPRGDDGAVVRIVDRKTLWLPDWHGNNRLDSLRNIVQDGRVSLMFMVQGCNNVVRISGTAQLTADTAITHQFKRNSGHPRTVITISIHEVYFQCAKALMRSKLWQPEGQDHRLPTAGQFIKEVNAGFDSETYDTGYAEYAKDKMW